jgi:hypothetical protein
MPKNIEQNYKEKAEELCRVFKIKKHIPKLITT